MVDTVDSLRVMVKLRWALRGQVPQLIGGTQRGGGESKMFTTLSWKACNWFLAGS